MEWYFGVTMTTTTLKLSPSLRRRISSLARHAGVTPHAFMVEAVEKQADAAEQRRRFVTEALEADAEMLDRGEGYRLEDVATWFRRRATGQQAGKPRAVKLR